MWCFMSAATDSAALLVFVLVGFFFAGELCRDELWLPEALLLFSLSLSTCVVQDLVFSDPAVFFSFNMFLKRAITG